MHIAVVGGGITGLAAALRLLRRAPGAEVTLFEKAERLGGEIHTERVDGFVIEAGADSFLTRKARGVGLCEELGLADRLVARQAQHAGTFVRHGGALHPLPEGLTGMIPTRIDSLTESALLSPEGRAALADEPSMPAPSDRREESIAEFVTRRFGREVYERIVEPLMAGIYGGDGERLSLDATFPQLRDLERRYGSVIRGLAASREQGAVDAAPPFVSFAGGMGELIEHLEARLRDASIQTSVEVVALEPRTGGGFVLVLSDGAGAEADAVILATPAPATARITRAFDRELSDLHAAIAYGVVGHREPRLPRARPPAAGRGLRLRRSPRRGLRRGCGSRSHRTSGRAARRKATHSSACTSGPTAGGDLTCETDDALVGAARRELKETYGVAAPPMLVRVAPLAGGGPAVHARSRRARRRRSASGWPPTAASSSRERHTPAWAFRTASLPARRLPTRHSFTLAPPTERHRAQAREPRTIVRKNIDRSIELFAAAQRLLPGGVDSPVRAFKAVGGQPLFIERGEGAYLVDVDGNRYIDYVLSWGPLILGHAHPRVVAAVQEAAARGTSYGAPSPLELGSCAVRGRTDARDRDGALRQLGHRGHHVRHPPGARVHPARRRSSSSRAPTTATPTCCSSRPVRASRRWGCLTRPA